MHKELDPIPRFQPEMLANSLRDGRLTLHSDRRLHSGLHYFYVYVIPHGVASVKMDTQRNHLAEKADRAIPDLTIYYNYLSYKHEHWKSGSKGQIAAFVQHLLNSGGGGGIRIAPVWQPRPVGTRWFATLPPTANKAFINARINRAFWHLLISAVFAANVASCLAVPVLQV